MEFVRSYDSTNFGLPQNRGGSAPASLFSGPAQRSLRLRPASSPSRLCDPLHQRLQQSRRLPCCSDCYRVERTSSRAGLTPAVDHHLFTAHPVSALSELVQIHGLKWREINHLGFWAGFALRRFCASLDCISSILSAQDSTVSANSRSTSVSLLPELFSI